MAKQQPPPISATEEQERWYRVQEIARKLGFAGTVEYRHVNSRSGGAQYGQGRTAELDVLFVYAEAFERDADPEDFSLPAIIAHERGHQLLCRHPEVVQYLGGKTTEDTEEIVASLLGYLILSDPMDRDALYKKAAFEVIARFGKESQEAYRWLKQFLEILEELL